MRSLSQYPSALVRLACTENSINVGYFGNHDDVEAIEDTFDSLTRRLYYDYFDGVRERPICRQEAWLECFWRFQEMISDRQELVQLVEEWRIAVDIYREWVRGCELDQDTIKEYWDRIVDFE